MTIQTKIEWAVHLYFGRPTTIHPSTQSVRHFCMNVCICLIFVDCHLFTIFRASDTTHLQLVFLFTLSDRKICWLLPWWKWFCVMPGGSMHISSCCWFIFFSTSSFSSEGVCLLCATGIGNSLEGIIWTACNPNICYIIWNIKYKIKNNTMKEEIERERKKLKNKANMKWNRSRCRYNIVP